MDQASGKDKAAVRTATGGGCSRRAEAGEKPQLRSEYSSFLVARSEADEGDFQHIRYRAIADISSLVAQCTSIESFYLRAAKIVAASAHADGAAIYLYSEADRCIKECVRSEEIAGDYLTLPVEVGRISNVIDEGKVILYQAVPTNPDDICAPGFADKGFECGLSVPITVCGETLGLFVLFFASQPENQDVSFLFTLGAVLGSSIRYAQQLFGSTLLEEKEGSDLVLDKLEGIIQILLAQGGQKKLSERGEAEEPLRAQRQVRYPIEPLSERDVSLLRLLAEGCSNVEIGNALFMSESTVKKRVGSLMRKLGVENRVQVAAYAFRAGYAK